MVVRIISFRLDEDTIQELDFLAKRKKTTRSELIREAIRMYLRYEWMKYKQEPKRIRLMC